MGRSIQTGWWILLVSGCAYLADPPRDEDGKIDREQVERDIDIDLTPHWRIDLENAELLFECKILEWWCVKDERKDN
jgi:hypothetical protein